MALTHAARGAFASTCVGAGRPGRAPQRRPRIGEIEIAGDGTTPCMRLACTGFCSWLVLGCAEPADDGSPVAEIVGEWRAAAVVEDVEDRLVVHDDGTAQASLHRQTAALSTRIEYEVDIVAEDEAFELAFDCDTFGCEMYEFTTQCELDGGGLVCLSAPDWYHREWLEFTRAPSE
jgi:hypothetical protein